MACTDLDLDWLTVVGVPDVWDLAVIGGRRPDVSWLAGVARRAQRVWAVDRGLDFCLTAGVAPCHVLGDFDSLAGDSAKRWLNEHRNQVKTLPIAKDATDFQVLLERMPSDRRLVVTGFWGGRFDHCLCNLLSLWGAALAGHPHRVACDDREFIWLLGPGESAIIRPSQPPKAVSLLPLTAGCDGVTTEGLRWNPRSHLEAWRPYAISNTTTGSPFRVSLSDGWLGLYLCKEEDSQAI